MYFNEILFLSNVNVMTKHSKGSFKSLLFVHCNFFIDIIKKKHIGTGLTMTIKIPSFPFSHLFCFCETFKSNHTITTNEKSFTPEATSPHTVQLLLPGWRWNFPESIRVSVCVCENKHTPTHNMLDLGQGADRQWNVNVCMLTNSTALWMGFVITPHHACIGPVPGPPILLPVSLSLSQFLPLSPQCLMGNHVVTLPDSLPLRSAVDKNSPRPVMWKRFGRHTFGTHFPPLAPPLTLPR